MDSLLGTDLDTEMNSGGPDGEEAPVIMKAPDNVPSAPVMSAPVLTLTNQGSAPPSTGVVDEGFMDIYKQMRGVYSNMDGDETAINNLALQSATVLYNMKKEMMSEVMKTREAVEVNTDEGKAIAYVMQQLPGINKEGARQVLQKTNQLRLEHAGSAPKGPASPKLSPHDRKMIRTLGLNEQSYSAVANQLEKGPSLDPEGVIRYENGIGVSSKGEVVFENF